MFTRHSDLLQTLSHKHSHKLSITASHMLANVGPFPVLNTDVKQMQGLLV